MKQVYLFKLSLAWQMIFWMSVVACVGSAIGMFTSDNWQHLTTYFGGFLAGVVGMIGVIVGNQGK